MKRGDRVKGPKALRSDKALWKLLHPLEVRHVFEDDGVALAVVRDSAGHLHVHRQDDLVRHRD